MTVALRLQYLVLWTETLKYQHFVYGIIYAIITGSVILYFYNRKLIQLFSRASFIFQDMIIIKDFKVIVMGTDITEHPV